MGDSPTIRSLAALAGVSKATVSLALRGSPKIRAVERERIQRIAQEAGYEPNAVMATLLAQIRASKTTAYKSSLGLVYALKDPAYFEMVTTYQEMFAACKTRARQLGYGMDEFHLNEPGTTPEQLMRILDARNICGLVVIGPFPNGIIPPAFDMIWERSASVVLGVRPVRPALSCASNDQFSTSKQAVWKLHELGYRRLGLCIDMNIDTYVEERFQAGFDVARKNLRAAERIPIFEYLPSGESRFRRWLKEYRPDAIITLHPEIRRWVGKAGLRVPEDIGLLHLDRTLDMTGWAGMQQNNHDIGFAAVDIVIGQLHRNELGLPPFQKCLFTSCTWIPGPTVRPQNGVSPVPSAASSG